MCVVIWGNYCESISIKFTHEPQIVIDPSRKCIKCFQVKKSCHPQVRKKNPNFTALKLSTVQVIKFSLVLLEKNQLLPMGNKLARTFLYSTNVGFLGYLQNRQCVFADCRTPSVLLNVGYLPLVPCTWTLVLSFPYYEQWRIQDFPS